MFRPVGPLSPSVYWRRRLLVAVLLVAVVLLLRALFGGGGPDNDGHDGVALPSESPVPTRTPLATITPSPGTGGPPASGQTSHAAEPAGDGGTGGAGSGSGTGSAGSVGSTGGSGTGGAGTPATCADAALRLTVVTDRADYPPGAKPVIRLALTNTASTPCRRDVGAAQQEAIVYAGRTPGQHQFWSSNDCDPGGDPDVRVLGPGDTLRFSVTWPAVSSAPDCAGTERAAGPGAYTVVARVGSLRSDPVTFTLT